MNISILIASILTFLAFIIHAFVGDKELRTLEPNESNDLKKREIWTMTRAGWHRISFDLLFATVLLVIINFTTVFENSEIVLQLLAIYFLGYSIFWLLTLIISKPFPKNYLKLGQWILLLTISGLIYFGQN